MGGGRRLSPLVEVEVEVSSFVGGLWLDVSLEVEVSSFVVGVWLDVSLEVEVSSFRGGLWVYASVKVVGASSFIGLVIFEEGSTEDSRFVCVWVIGLVSVITDTGLCVIISCALAMQTLLWSGGQTWLCSDGQIWFWSDGQGWNSMQV